MENPKDETRPLATVSLRPVHDEWGIYDPEQAGLTAVLRRLLPAADTTPADSEDVEKPPAN